MYKKSKGIDYSLLKRDFFQIDTDCHNIDTYIAQSGIQSIFRMSKHAKGALIMLIDIIMFDCNDTKITKT